jgi:hypothetical protein
MTKSFCKIFRFAYSTKITPSNKISRKIFLLKYTTLRPSTRALNWFGRNRKRGITKYLEETGDLSRSAPVCDRPLERGPPSSVRGPGLSDRDGNMVPGEDVVGRAPCVGHRLVRAREDTKVGDPEAATVPDSLAGAATSNPVPDSLAATAWDPAPDSLISA